MKGNLTKNKLLSGVFLAVISYVLLSLFIWFTVVKNQFYGYGIKTIVFYYISIAVFFSAFLFYMYFVDIEALSSSRKTAAIFTVFIVNYVIIYYCSLINSNLAPLALTTLILTLLVGAKSAVFANVMQILILFTTNFVFEVMDKSQLFVCLFIGLSTVTISAFSIKYHNKRISYVGTGVALSIISAVAATIIYFMFLEGAFVLQNYLTNVLFALGGGMLNIMLMFLLLPLFEKMFNITTDFRLAELTNTNQPLLKRLFNEAPGTFNHSMTVANYTEACAMAIGENTYLARAAGYYHDIGKLRNPVYFSENQRDGYNPHNEIAPEVSVSFLKNHIVYGLSLARTYKLPVELERAIIEHHGSFVMKFFYTKAKQYTEGELSLRDYCYEGPTPTTKINGILMVVDACEAALRSLSVDDKAKAEKVVEGIVKERMEFGQFDNCDLTMKEIDTIKQTIITTYMGARHERVKYPEIAISAENKQEENITDTLKEITTEK